MHWNRSDRQLKESRWLPVGILLLAGALRLVHAGTASLWFDEAFAVLTARLSLGELLATVASDVHPPLYFVLLHFWQKALGESEFAVRWFSGLCSVLSVAGVYRLGARLFSRRAGLWAAGLMAVAPFQVYYAQEARSYALCVLLSVWLLWAFVEVVMVPSLVALVGYVCAATFGLYTHYFFGFVLVALHLWALIFHRSRRIWQALLLGAVGVFVLFLPGIGLALSHTQMVMTGFWIGRPSVLGALKTLDFLLFAGTTPRWLVGVALFGTIGLLAVLCLDLARLRPRRGAVRAAIVLCLLVVGLPLVVAFVVSQFGSSIYLDRSFALVTPAYALLLGLGLSVRPRRSPALILVFLLGIVAVVSLANFYLWPDPAKSDFRQAGRLVRERTQPGDQLLHLHDSTCLSLRYYAPDVDAAIVENDRPWLLPEAWPRFATHVPAGWIETLPVGARLWVAVEPRMYGHRQQEVLESLTESWQQIERFEVRGVWLYLFRKDAR